MIEFPPTPPPKKRRGRPKGIKSKIDTSGYMPEFDKQAYKLCMLKNCIDTELAEFFEISVSTLKRWCKKYPSFGEAINKGKEESDFNVVKSLYSRAVGYSHPEEKVFMHDGEPVIVNTTKHYPPDTVACLAWLNNRQRDTWRNKDHQASVEQTANIASALQTIAEKLPV